MKQKHIGFILLFGIAIYFLGSWNLPITDNTESNYAETAKEMIQAGDYFSPRIFGNFWFDKPIMFYLELILAFKFLGMTDFAARLFPAIFAIASLVLTYFFGKRYYGANIGFIAAILLGTSLEYWYIGHAVITDTTLLTAISITLMSFFRGYTENKPKFYYLAFVAAGVAILTKGPIGLCLPGLIILIFLAVKRRLKALLNIHILLGFMLCLLTASIWYYPMYLVHGKEFLDTFIGVHNVTRATVAEHPRDNVWYYYILVFLAGFFPWSFILSGLGLKNLYNKGKSIIAVPKSDLTCFLLIWALTVFAVFNIFATKYLTYTYPYMVPLALLFAPIFSSRLKLFFSVAGIMTIFYLGAMFTIVPKIMYDNSALPIAEFFNEHKDADTKLMSYHINGLVGLAYYEGIVTERLETPENIEKFTNPANGWNKLNILPMRSITELDLANDYIVMTKKKFPDDFKENVLGNWQEIGTVGEWLFFRNIREEN